LRFFLARERNHRIHTEQQRGENRQRRRLPVEHRAGEPSCETDAWVTHGAGSVWPRPGNGPAVTGAPSTRDGGGLTTTASSRDTPASTSICSPSSAPATIGR